MYVHIGKGSVIDLNDVIGIFDIENTSTSKTTREFLVKMSKEEKVVYVNEDLPKSFIIVKKGKENVIYITSLASSTLKKRSDEGPGKTVLVSEKGMVKNG